MKTKLFNLSLALLTAVIGVQAQIQIDGDFSDWDNVAIENLAHDSLHKDYLRDCLYDMKWTEDNQNFAFYLEFDTNGTDEIGIFMNINNSSTGFDTYFDQLWNGFANYMIEFEINTPSAAELHRFPITANQHTWEWESMDTPGFLNCCPSVILPNGHAAMEGKILKSAFPEAISSLNLGVCTYSNWTPSGALPNAYFSDDDIIFPPMLSVPLLLEDTTSINPNTTFSGTCGDNLTWTLQDSTLTISGTGAMTDWEDVTYGEYNPECDCWPIFSNIPWFSQSSSISSIVINDGVTTIGNYAFSICWNVKTIIIPNSVTNIGDYAFAGCPITAITIPNGITSIREGTFSGCDSLVSISIPNSVTSIGDGAFWYCGLTSVTIPNSVTTIGEGAFSECWRLTSIIIPNSVTSIGEGAFMNCHNLTSITLPNSISIIGDYVFEGCGLTSINIPNSVTSIGICAFRYCTDLASVNIPNSVSSIGDGAFSSCYSLINLTIPNSVTHLESYPFYMVPNVSYSGNLQGAPWGARCLNGFVEYPFVFTDSTRTTLAACSGAAIENVSVPNGVTTIGESAFYYCSKITFIALPNSVTSIERDAFKLCYNLASINIPEGVTSLSRGIFENCSHLSSLFVYMDTPAYIPITISIATVFSPGTDFSTIDCYVKNSSLSLYQQAERWQEMNLHGVPLYTVTFLDWDNSILCTQSIMQGDQAIAPQTPEREGYNFIGWSDTYTNIQSNLTITARYEPSSITDLENLQPNQPQAVKKHWENGQLYILLPDGTRYDASGKKVE